MKMLIVKNTAIDIPPLLCLTINIQNANLPLFTQGENMDFHWVVKAIICGIFFGVATPLTNAASQNSLSVPHSVLAFSLVWIVMSGTYIQQTGSPLAPSYIGIAYAMAAGILFWCGNFFQFRATLEAPFAAYAVLTVTSCCVVVMLAIDIIAKWLKNQPIGVSWTQAAAITMIFTGIALLTRK